METLFKALATLGSLVTAIGVFFIWRQTKLLRKQMQDDHERSRREMLIEVMQNWNQHTSPFSAAAQKLVAKLNKDQCQAIFRIQPIDIDSELIPLAKAALDSLGKRLKAEGSQAHLGVQEVAHLRYLIIDYLNTLEISLSAWYLGIVDLDQMEEEFTFLIDRSIPDPTLKKFREGTGPRDGFPALQAFIKKLENKAPSQKSAPLG